MKRLLLVALVLFGVLLWRFAVRGDGLLLLVPASDDRVSASVTRVLPDREIVIEVRNPSREQRITEITTLRSIVEALQLGPPDGFQEEPLTLTEQEAGDREMVEFVEHFNLENVRWVGDHPLLPESVEELAIPLGRTVPSAGELRFQYSSRRRFGSSIAFFDVSLAGYEQRSEP